MCPTRGSSGLIKTTQLYKLFPCVSRWLDFHFKNKTDSTIPQFRMLAPLEIVGSSASYLWASSLVPAGLTFRSFAVFLIHRNCAFFFGWASFSNRFTCGIGKAMLTQITGPTTTSREEGVWRNHQRARGLSGVYHPSLFPGLSTAFPLTTTID